MTLSRLLVLTLMGCGALAGQQAPAAGEALGRLSAEELAEGRRLYERHCAACHAPDGGGGRGAVLNLPRLRRAGDDEGLLSVIRKGVPGTEMPPTWQMTERELRRVAGYVRTLGRTAVEPLPGDAGRGRALYVSTGCPQCHIVRGEGSGLGPELTAIGATRNAAYLREALVEPARSAPDRFLMVRATLAAGGTVYGSRLNEDPFTIQIRDLANQFHSLRKSGLGGLKKLPGETWMPAYAGLPPRDLDDLVAYLASLRGEP